MGTSYHQFCPVAKAMELLDERWTMLVVRELAAGSERFNDLRRGVPRMSPSLLSKRLDQLVRAGIVDRYPDGRYVLNAAGQELRPIVDALGAWGLRWIGELGEADLDPKLLLWDMRRNVRYGALPPGRTVVEFRFPDAAAARRYWWLVMADGEADVCDADPGHPVTLRVTASLRRLVQVWRGDVTWRAVQSTGEVTVDGPTPLCRAMPDWFTLSPFAAVPRPVAAANI